ncbi:carbohydrate-binding module family 1 protein [Auriscalpium vulgare]|uniref:Carbohydrate-binding module family 1 protein n=1 Tax=Auriscalpium vulgare TaxID=40419 RepID=A0ACB8SD65_9AGAM|nr:carbohydrate-binding module family 1 protein [Auriscalpium vulgare]
MKRATFAAFTLACFVTAAHAQSGAYGQCGGTGWSGATTCVSGYTCTYSNPYYSQCLPGTASSSSSGSSSSASTSPTVTSSSTTASTTTSTGATPTGSQIRSDQDPVFHFYLQNQAARTLSLFFLPGGAAVLGPVGTSGYFTLGTTITLPNTDGSLLYLNVNESAPNSYKPLLLGTTATTTDWGLEGDTIITTSPRQLNFLACPTSDSTVYSVYLQEGNDTPSGSTCSLVSLHLDCLC